MLNDPKLDRNDSLGVILRSAYSKMNPPPALEKAVRSGIPYTPRANTAIHVRRFAKAIVSYALCIVLLVGGVYLASQLMGGIEPFTSSPSKATTGRGPKLVPVLMISPFSLYFTSFLFSESFAANAGMQSRIENAAMSSLCFMKYDFN